MLRNRQMLTTGSHTQPAEAGGSVQAGQCSASVATSTSEGGPPTKTDPSQAASKVLLQGGGGQRSMGVPKWGWRRSGLRPVLPPKDGTQHGGRLWWCIKYKAWMGNYGIVQMKGRWCSWEWGKWYRELWQQGRSRQLQASRARALTLRAPLRVSSRLQAACTAQHGIKHRHARAGSLAPHAPAGAPLAPTWLAAVALEWRVKQHVAAYRESRGSRRHVATLQVAGSLKCTPPCLLVCTQAKEAKHAAHHLARSPNSAPDVAGEETGKPLHLVRVPRILVACRGCGEGAE